MNIRLKADFEMESVHEITAAFLKAHGIYGIIADIDYTLEPDYVPTPSAEIFAWAKGLIDQGIPIYLVSNNSKKRVSLFAKSMNLPSIHRAMKPFMLSLYRACRAMGLRRDQVVMVGDKAITDILGAHLCGMRAILVKALRREKKKERRASPVNKPGSGGKIS